VLFSSALKYHFHHNCYLINRHTLPFVAIIVKGFQNLNICNLSFNIVLQLFNYQSFYRYRIRRNSRRRRRRHHHHHHFIITITTTILTLSPFFFPAPFAVSSS
jgi:hypothetical protein